MLLLLLCLAKMKYVRKLAEMEYMEKKKPRQTYIQVSHHVDDLTCGVRVVDETLVGHVSQLSKRQHQFPQHVFWDTRSVLTQHGQL